MYVLLLLFISFWESEVASGGGAKLELSRCAQAKEQNPALLAVVVVVSSRATEFSIRSHLRETQFQDASSLHSRTVFQGSMRRQDKRPVCVEHIFVLSPWTGIRNSDNDQIQRQVVQQDEWRRVIAETRKYQDILISPIMVDGRTRARELMHVLEWSRQTAPWADYTVSTDTSVHLHWAHLIQVFPPPLPPDNLNHTFWHLGSDDSTVDALFFKEPRRGTWQKCANVQVAAFSRDLVLQMTGIPFEHHIMYALRQPLRMHLEDCTLGALSRTSACMGYVLSTWQSTVMFWVGLFLRAKLHFIRCVTSTRIYCVFVKSTTHACQARSWTQNKIAVCLRELIETKQLLQYHIYKFNNARARQMLNMRLSAVRDTNTSYFLLHLYTAYYVELTRFPTSSL